MDSDSRYELGYDYAKQVLSLELDHVQKLDAKAHRILGLLSVLIVAFTLAIRFLMPPFFPPSHSLHWLILFFVVLALLAFINCWGFLYRAIRVMEVPRMPFDAETLERIERNSQTTNWWLFTKTSLHAFRKARKVNMTKAKYLSMAHSELAISLALAAWSLFLIGLCWVFPPI